MIWLSLTSLHQSTLLAPKVSLVTFCTSAVLAVLLLNCLLGFQQNKERYISKLFLRGDSVILVLRNPN